MVKYFVASLEWLESYGTRIIGLRARTPKGADKETTKLLEDPANQISPSGYTVMTEDQLRKWHGEIEVALGLEASAGWTVDDVLTVKKSMSRAEAEEWLAANSKYIRDAMIQAGWNTIETL